MTTYNGSNTAAGVYTGREDNSFVPSQTNPSTGAIVFASNRGKVMQPVLATTITKFREKFGLRDANVSFAHFHAERFLKSASQLWCVRVDDGAEYGSFRVRIEGNYSIAVPATSGLRDPEDYAFEPEELILFYGADQGAWNNDVRVLLYPDVNDMEQELFIVEVYENNYSVPVETYRATLREKMINGVQVDLPYQLENADSRIRARINYENTALVERPTFRHVNAIVSADLTHGANGSGVTESDIIDAWQLFENGDDYDLRLLLSGGYTGPALAQALLQVAKRRGPDCYPLIDVPYEYQGAMRAVDYRQNILNIDDASIALCSNWIEEYTQEGQKILVPSSGAYAERMAYTDNLLGIHFAAAGTERGVIPDVSGLGVEYDLGERNQLEQNQINYIQKLSGYGYVIMNYATLQRQKSARSDINVERMIIDIETKARYEALMGVFEPNDAYLWAELRSLVESILQPYVKGRGIYAAQVYCDETTNTPATIAAGDVILVYVIQPSRYAKRILFTTSIAKTGETNTVVSSL